MIIRVVHYRPEGIVLQMLPAEHYRTLIYGLRVGRQQEVFQVYRQALILV